MELNGKCLEKVYDVDVKNGTVVIPKYIEIIEESAFCLLNNLTFIIINRNVMEIHQSAFRDCVNLRTCIIENENCELYDFLFMCCTNLKTVQLPKRLQGLGTATFACCENLKNYRMDVFKNVIVWKKFGFRIVSIRLDGMNFLIVKN